MTDVYMDFQLSMELCFSNLLVTVIFSVSV